MNMDEFFSNDWEQMFYDFNGRAEDEDPYFSESLSDYIIDRMYLLDMPDSDDDYMIPLMNSMFQMPNMEIKDEMQDDDLPF